MSEQINSPEWTGLSKAGCKRENHLRLTNSLEWMELYKDSFIEMLWEHCFEMFLKCWNIPFSCCDVIITLFKSYKHISYSTLLSVGENYF